MKKITKSLLVSAAVLMTAAPVVSLATDTTTNTVQATANFNEHGYWVGPSIAIHYNNAVQVKTGAAAYDLTQVKAGDVTAQSADGDNMGLTATGDQTLYKTETGAVLQNGTDVATNPTATAGGTYYQRVNIKLNDVQTDNILASQRIMYTNAKVTFNDAAMGYHNIANGKNSFVVFRTVTVSDNPSDLNNSNYRDIKTNGVVKTLSANATTPLYDANGQKIGTRALAPNSAWYTDTQRVASNGNVYYRVSTSEYVAEKDIEFHVDPNATPAN